MLTANGIRAEMIYLLNSQRVENVYHFTKGSPASAADLEALRVILVNWENNVAKPQRPNNTSLVLIELTALDSLSAPFLSSQTGLPIVGTMAGNGMVSFLSVAVRHTTGLTGRSRRGRSYWVGLGANHLLNNDSITSAAATSLTSVYTQLRTLAAAGGFTFVVNSLYSGVTVVNGYRRAVPRAAGVMTSITSSSCETGIDSQRHRKLPSPV